MESTPLWDGPLLRAPFVAQVLGQAAENAHEASPDTYGRKRLPAGILFDEWA